jgi:predicted ATPase
VTYLQQLSVKQNSAADTSSYPFSIPAIAALEKLSLNQAVTFFVGENGSGKSTLLEAIAMHQGFNSEGGTKNFNFSTHNNTSALHEHLIISKGTARPSDGFFLRAESFYNVATYTEEIALPKDGKPYHQQSHGEAFLDLLLNKLRGNGLYLFDEPEAAISPQRQLAVLLAIKNLVEKKSQLIIATHSPILMAYPGAVIYQFSDVGIAQVAYEDTEHYVFTKQFISNYQAILKATL